jgi:hypothetical protein
MRSIALNIFLLSALISAAPADNPCLGVPAKVDPQSVLALVNAGVQDINDIANPQNGICE